jgi:hypothetical protein
MLLNEEKHMGKKIYLSIEVINREKEKFIVSRHMYSLSDLLS